MNGKKKPPPGATLISRLREGRLRREQQLAERKAQEEAGKAVEPEATPAPAAVKETAPAAKEKPAPAAPVSRESRRRAKAAEEAPAAAKDVVVDATVTASLEAAVEGQAAAVIAERAVEVTAARAAVEMAPPPAPVGGLIRRSISIDDLRPVSDDYELLTEEIRLAGRFAAAGLIAQGMRLARLKDDEIYKVHYQTFEDYCRKEHSMSATYAYRLIRMAEMAERLAEEGTRSISGEFSDSMPDPFEVMLSLGHRHLLALLPLETEKAEELLVKGIPVADDSGEMSDRIPITQATEQQIRQALKLILPPEAQSRARPKTHLAPVSRSVRTLADIVELLQEWANWLESDPDEKVVADRVGEGREKSRLVQRFRNAAERLLGSL